METRYVGVQNCADDQFHGKTQAAPYQTIQYGLDQLAALASGKKRLVIAVGRYKENVRMAGKKYSGISIEGDTPVTSGPVAVFCEARPVVDGAQKDNVFDITSVSDVTLKNLSIVNGAGKNRRPSGGGVYAGRSALTLISCCFENNQANLGGAFALDHCSALCTIQECRVFDNKAKAGGGLGRGKGGGGYLEECDDVWIEKSSFWLNTSDGRGGALHIEKCNQVHIVKQNKFWANTADQHGGAIAVSEPPDGSLVAILDSEFSNANAQEPSAVGSNTAQYGGAIAIIGNDQNPPEGGLSPVEQLYLGNNEIHHNTAVFSKQTTGGYGAAVFAGYSVNVRFEDNRIHDNIASDHGGALYATQNCLLTLLGANNIHDNLAGLAAGKGGGLYALNSDVAIYADTIFANNGAGNDGGGVAIEVSAPDKDTDAYLRKAHCRFNYATIRGANFQGNSAGKGFGGGLWCWQGDWHRLYVDVLDQTTFSNNSADIGGGFCADNPFHFDFRNNSLDQNLARMQGGGGCVQNMMQDNANVKDNDFTGNQSPRGAGLELLKSTVTYLGIRDNKFSQSRGSKDMELRDCSYADPRTRKLIAWGPNSELLWSSFNNLARVTITP